MSVLLSASNDRQWGPYKYLWSNACIGQVEFAVYGLDAKFLHSSLEVGNRKASIHTLLSSLWRFVARAWLPLLTHPTRHRSQSATAVFAQTYPDRNSPAVWLGNYMILIHECAFHGWWVSLEPSVWWRKRCLSGVKM